MLQNHREISSHRVAGPYPCALHYIERFQALKKEDLSLLRGWDLQWSLGTPRRATEKIECVPVQRVPIIMVSLSGSHIFLILFNILLRRRTFFICIDIMRKIWKAEE